MKHKSEHACPACGQVGSCYLIIEGLVFRNELRLPVIHCENCNHRWLRSTESEQKIIEESYSAVYAGFRVDEFFNKTVTEELEHRISKLSSPPARLLDVGCGNGEFLYCAQKFGYDCLGIDVSADGVAIAASKGLNALNVDYLTYEFPHRYHLITMWDVVEHLQNPNAFIERARQLLEPRGHLVLKVPSFGERNFRVLRWFPSKSGLLLGAPDHVQYFSRKSMEALLKRSGFSEITWYEAKQFRTKPPTKSLKKKIGRSIQKSVGEWAGNENLYLVASLSAKS